MKDAVCRASNISGDNIFVIRPNILEEKQDFFKKNFNFRSFFYPTSSLSYKNNSCIYEACEYLIKKGYNDFDFEMTINKEVNIENINFLGRISRELVLEKYNSKILVFPSYIESFGYPLVEAKATGTIIFASDCEFSRELLENYSNAYFFDPFNPIMLGKLMNKAINGEIVKHTIVEKVDVEVNTWENVVAELLSI